MSRRHSSRGSWRSALLGVLGISGVSNGATLQSRASPHCVDFTLPVTASADNKVIFSPTHDLNTVSGVLSFLGSGAGVFGQDLGTIPQSGTFPMSARYCAPQANEQAPAARKKHVQLLLHGIPYNKDYWFGLKEEAPAYSWVNYMTALGYPVLTVDNLGGGNSTVHPDPVLTVQQPLETEIMREIAMMLRAGTVPNAPKAAKVIYGGHSYASVLGNAIATKYPTDVDAFILTGYTYTIDQAVPGVLLDLVEPAVLYNPKEYGSLSPAYLTFGSESGKDASYYAAPGTFDPAIAHYDFLTQGITTVGEIVTFFSGLEQAANFTGDVLVITGQNDALFCGDGSRDFGPQNCGYGANSIPARSKSFWPNANYQYYMPPGTSHATDLSLASQQVFEHAAKWLAAQGY